jgi:tetratricopeptide (TPR) repeat protein
MSRKILFALAAALAASATALPAGAAVTVLGNSPARLCYLSAENRLRPPIAALVECDTALAIDSLATTDRVATFVNRGILKLRLGRTDSAIADFDSAIGLDANEAEAYLNKGMAILHREQGWEQALSLFDTAIGKRTRRPELAYYGRAVANEMGGRIAAAYRDYRQASALAPNWDDPKTELARFSVRQR